MIALDFHPNFKFEPPLRLVGPPIVVISTSTEAADFCREHTTARRPLMRNGALRMLEAARTVDEEREAVKLFTFWVEGEQLGCWGTNSPEPKEP
jgi:hypothetical protein